MNGILYTPNVVCTSISCRKLDCEGFLIAGLIYVEA